MHTWPAAFIAFMASIRLEYLFAATAPRIAAPKSTDSFSRGSIIGQPAAINTKKLTKFVAECPRMPIRLESNILQNVDDFSSSWCCKCICAELNTKYMTQKKLKKKTTIPIISACCCRNNWFFARPPQARSASIYTR